MVIALSQSHRAVLAGSPARSQARLAQSIMFPLLMIAVLFSVNLPNGAQAMDSSASGPALEARVQALIPEIESYVASGMKAFDTPGLALGIVANDRLVYGKGFGVRSKTGDVPTDTRTVFQIGSTTKAFLATTLAIMVDRGKLRWDDRVVDLQATGIPFFTDQQTQRRTVFEAALLKANPDHRPDLPDDRYDHAPGKDPLAMCISWTAETLGCLWMIVGCPFWTTNSCRMQETGGRPAGRDCSAQPAWMRSRRLWTS